MENLYYPNQLFDSIEIPLEVDGGKEGYCNQNTAGANGLVFHHLQQTLQVQTNLKNRQRVQDFLHGGKDDPVMGFDELYSSMTSESDISYSQFMQQTTPFDTPIEPVSSTLNSSTFDYSSLPTSVAGLNTGCSLSTSYLPSEHQYLLCHSLNPFPDITYDVNSSDHLPCDYYFSDSSNILAGLTCSTGFVNSNCFTDMNSTTFIPPLLPYPSPSIHETAASLSGITSDYHHLAFRSNSTPMLSASYSYSSFSSASSNEDDSGAEDNTSPKPTKQGPKKSASISFIPEKRKQKKNNNGYMRKNSITQPRKFSKKNSTMSSNSLSYFLSKQQLSDTEEFDDDYEDDGRNKMRSSVSSGILCKKGRNVDKACNHCKRSHLRCDNVRPCRRCVATGKVGCQDVKHKPRGRPRLQKRL